ncbi:histone acetyltransferase [Caerostris extrusa]|uniref:Histone acetyltransferase n=1 Tax=Caerostris extrusa TaxID=172846 RepID=A0AAV4RHQ1_CAEEX|nr:histone acetyltransferase [Caerostris extrusa]
MQNSKLPVAQTAGEHNAVPCSGSAADTATAGAIANSDPAPTVDQEKLRLNQKQLVLLLHAYACRSKDCQSANDRPACVPLKQATARKQQAATVQTTQSNKELRLADKQRAYAEPGLKFSTSNDGIGKNTIVQAGHLMSDQVVHSCSSQNLNHIPAFQPDQKDIQQSPLQMEYMLQNNAFFFSKLKNIKCYE